MDRRLTPANGRVAAARLEGEVEACRFTEGEPRRVTVPVADLLAAPGGKRDRQLLMGAEVRLYETRSGWAFVEAETDGYVGYLPEGHIGAPVEATHWVSAAASHLYDAPDLKTPARALLSLGSRLQVSGTEGRFSRTPDGWVATAHLTPVSERATDPVEIAARLIGSPYLWGGNARSGIDCSGLVQVACHACGLPCPGDSDQQEQALGQALDPEATLRRGDLLFWKGHVAWVSDADTLLHANAHHMAVAFEPLAEAIRRIEAQGDGPVTGRRRIDLPADAKGTA